MPVLNMPVPITTRSNAALQLSPTPAPTRTPMPMPMPRPRLRRFANPDVVCQGWYAVGPTRKIRPGTITRASIGKRDIVLYRDLSGELRAIDRQCGHLGADLAQGTVVAKGLQCAFHRWCWGPDGACTAGGGVAGGARIRAYHVRERWGLAWVWAGDSPAYDLPMPEAANQAHVVRLPPQRLACHGHVVLGNGLDVTHVVPVHRFRFLEDPIVDTDRPHHLSVSVRTRFDSTVMRRLLGLAGREARWHFTGIGPSLAWVKVTSPTPFELVWAARPLADGSCATQTIFFLPRWSALVRALPMMVATTWADRRVLTGLEFHPGFVASDDVFEQYARLIEEIPEW
jgi:phenylpropionate dioxygenase-like ring-hydroxylating dioxygenase large terminal subunit